MIRKIVCPAILVFWVFGAGALRAQINTGKIEGKIIDVQTGAPLVGAQVMVDGTRLGNVANNDGYYFVLNIPPGIHSITATYTGYQSVSVQNQRIQAGQTTTINFQMSSAVFELETLVVEGESEILVPRDNTLTKRRFTAEMAENIATSSLDDVIELQAGVEKSDRGFQIRGGRIGEEVVFVDGVMVKNFSASPMAPSYGETFIEEASSYNPDVKDNNPLEISTNAVEEVQILTGGFNAEYGNAQSGVINIVTQEGSPQIKGKVRFRTDGQQPRTSDYGFNELQLNLSGPVAPVKHAYFFVSSEMQGRADFTPSHSSEVGGFRGFDEYYEARINRVLENEPLIKKRFSLDDFREARRKVYDDPAAELYYNSNPVRLPGNEGDRWLTSSKLTWSPTTDLKFLVSHHFSRFQRRYYNHEEIFLVEDHKATRTKTHSFTGGADWVIYQSASRNINLQVRGNYFRDRSIDYSSVKNIERRNTVGGFSFKDYVFTVEDLKNMTDEAGNPLSDVIGGNEKYLPYGKSNSRNDPMFYDNIYEGINDNPFGVSDKEGPRMYGQLIRYAPLMEVGKNIKTDLDFQINRTNRAKVGLDAHYLHVFRNTLTPTSTSIDNMNNVLPKIISAYAQDRLDLGDFICDVGLRYDYFDPVQNRTNIGGAVIPMEVDTRDVFAPRLGIGFPVTDNSQIRFSYGQFFQPPPLDVFYSSPNRGGLTFSKTTAFEAGFSMLLGNDFLLDFVGFNRDVDGNVSIREMVEPETGTRRVFLTNLDSGNIKGFDLTISKRFSRYYSQNLSYTLSFSRATGSQIRSASAFKGIDPVTGEYLSIPSALRPVSGDRTHSFSYIFNLRLPEDFAPGLWYGTVFKNFGAFVTLTIKSGQAYTRISPETFNYMETVNSSRLETDFNLDLRLSKQLFLGSRRLTFFTEVYNVLNQSRDWPMFTRFDSQLNESLSGTDVLQEAINRSVAPSNNADYDYNDFGATWVNPGKYDLLRDLNLDGKLDWEERVITELNYLAGYYDWADPRHLGTPRQVRVGVEFQF
ncbi:MAG: TonB-dependent receptor [Candidatus Glassbacteria bacterium]|nr:TonB-dependent receptor [Candidatus Glassbacteria bacterium]